MKTAHWISLFLTAGMFTFAACGNKQPPPPKQIVVNGVKQVDVSGIKPIEVSGVKLDQPKFQQVFSGSIQFSESVGKVSKGIYYHQYDLALKELKLLAANPGLNDQQKQVVADLTEQVTQLMGK